jgi:uncharacterized RDD family membrane protein YckC
MPIDNTDPTLATVEAVDVSLPLAGIGSRSYAFVIDWHIRLIAAAVWFFGVFLLARALGSSASRGGDYFLVALIPTVAIYFLYHPLLETLLRGSTPGKRTAGIRVVDRHGGLASPGVHLTRNLFRLLDSLPGVYAFGLLAMSLTRNQSRIGDLVAGTLVIFETSESPAALELLARTPLEPRLALLIDETLQRWKQLEPARRDALGRQLLERAGRPLPNATGAGLREALRALLV